MADKAKKSIWLRFFRDAGIPSGYDTKYALIFDENRIKMDMLMDINKECLKDMGISAMGDIIAILKHAKYVYEDSKAQAYDVPQPTSTVTALSQSSLSKIKASPTGSTSSSGSGGSSGSGPRSVIINVNKTATSAPNKTDVSNATTTTSRLGGLGGGMIKRVVPSSGSTSTVLVKSSNGKAAANPNPTGIKRTTTNTVVRLKRSVTPPQREEVPLQKKTRVLREQEGSYIIKMPEGTTNKTQKLLQDRLGPNLGRSGSVSTNKKSSVFARLGGESKVSSSTSSEPTILRRNSPERSPSRDDVSKSKSSVFARLGGNSSSAAATDIKPLIPSSRSEFLQTRFEVKQSVPSPKPAAKMISLSSTVPRERINPNVRRNDDLLFKTEQASRMLREDSYRTDRSRSRNSPEYDRSQRDTRISSTVSRMRSEGSGNSSVKSRLGIRGLDSSSRSRSRSYSPPLKRVITTNARIAPPRNSASSSSSASNNVVKRKVPVPIQSPRTSSARKVDSTSNRSLPVSKVIREERFTNAQGKNMIRRTVLKSVTKRM